MNKTSQTQFAIRPLIVLAVGVALLNGNLGVYVVPFQIGAWMDGLKYSASQSGMLGMLEIAAMSITAIIISPMMSRWSKTGAAVIGAAVAIAAQVATAFVDQYYLLTTTRFFVGVGSGLIFAAVVAAIALTREPDRLMGFGQAVMNLLFMGIFVIVPYTLLWQVHRGLFLSLATLMLLSMFAYRLLPDQNSPDVSRDSSAPFKDVGARVFCHFVAIAVLNLGLGALWGFVERQGIQIGLTAETIGAVLSASTIAMIAGSLFAGWLGVRIGRALPMLVASLLCGTSVLGIMAAETLPVYASAVMLYGAAYLFLGPYIIVGIGSALDPSGRLAPACGGVMFLFYSLGIGGGGYIVDAFSYAAIGWIALAGCIVSGIMFFINASALDTVETAA